MKTIILRLVLCSLVCIASFSVNGQNSDQIEKYNQALNLLKNKKYGSACSLLTPIIERGIQGFMKENQSLFRTAKEYSCNPFGRLKIRSKENKTKVQESEITEGELDEAEPVIELWYIDNPASKN